jgi:hypothetical protein
MSISLKVVSMAYVFWAPFSRSATRMRNRVIFTRLHTGCQCKQSAQLKCEQGGVRHNHFTDAHVNGQTPSLPLWPGPSVLGGGLHARLPVLLTFTCLLPTPVVCTAMAPQAACQHVLTHGHSCAVA